MRTVWAIVIIITILAALLRFINIEQNPPALYWDELSIGYNAYSIHESGKDEHGKTFPIHFAAFGEQKLPVYIYLTAGSIAAFGNDTFSIRFPSALLGVATVPLTFLLIRSLPIAHKKQAQKVAVVAAFLLAISPWHIQFSRGGFEATAALFFIVVGTWLLFGKKPHRQLLGVVGLLLAFYTYNAARIFVPIFLPVVLYLVNRSQTLTKTVRIGIGVAVLVGFALLLPGIADGTLFARAAQASAFVESSRRFPTPIPLVSHVLTFAANAASYMSANFLFFHGDGIGRHGVREIGHMHLFELPLVIIGIWLLVRQRWTSGKTILIVWIAATILAAATSRPSPHGLRSLFLVVPYHTISAIGAVYLLQIFKRQTAMLKYIGYTTSVVVVIFFVTLYLRFYHIAYPSVTALDWQVGYKELFAYVSEIADEYDTIMVTNWYGPSYIAGLYYLSYDPSKYHTETPQRFGKYRFGDRNDQAEQPQSRSLMIYPANIDADGKKVHSIYLSNGDVVFDAWEI